MEMEESAKILIVDDSAAVRFRLKEMLSEIPGVARVEEAEDASQALQAVSELHPDVVILDIRMPGGTGIDVLKGIRGNSRSSSVIMFTNYPSEQYKKRCIELGADFFLDKSSDVERLMQIVRELAETRLTGP